MSPDSVVLELALVDMPTSELAAVEDLWKGIDEQQFPTDVRRRLSDLGFRCGTLGEQLPSWLTRHLEQQSTRLVVNEGNGTASVSDVPTLRRIQCREGDRRSIPVADVQEELIVQPSAAPAPRPPGVSNSGAEARETQRYGHAQCHLAITAHPHGDGQVRVTLTPEIQYGQFRQHWVGEEGSFRIEDSRDSQRFGELTVEATLRPGQTLCLATTPQAVSLGKAFFCVASPASSSPASESKGTAVEDGLSASDSPRRLVLVRLAQTQTDDLFSPHQWPTPITTAPQ
jgi:hypothetical protein